MSITFRFIYVSSLNMQKLYFCLKLFRSSTWYEKANHIKYISEDLWTCVKADFFWAFETFLLFKVQLIFLNINNTFIPAFFLLEKEICVYCYKLILHNIFYLNYTKFGNTPLNTMDHRTPVNERRFICKRTDYIRPSRIPVSLGNVPSAGNWLIKCSCHWLVNCMQP